MARSTSELDQPGPPAAWPWRPCRASAEPTASSAPCPGQAQPGTAPFRRARDGPAVRPAPFVRTAEVEEFRQLSTSPMLGMIGSATSLAKETRLPPARLPTKTPAKQRPFLFFPHCTGQSQRRILHLTGTMPTDNSQCAGLSETWGRLEASHSHLRIRHLCTPCSCQNRQVLLGRVKLLIPTAIVGWNLPGTIPQGRVETSWRVCKNSGLHPSPPWPGYRVTWQFKCVVRAATARCTNLISL